MPRSANKGLSTEVLELVAARFRLLSEPTRLRILQELREGERSVGDLADTVEMTQPNVSKHLKTLYEAGILARRAAGASTFYRIDDPSVFALCDLVCGGLSERASAQAAMLKNANRR